ncbi:helix-turn-helix transcriptional regulator [Zoogloea sp. 1C4]|jgi:transcriptional regulator with XRE-family HTH domain|uniref:helix-turn-helix domain-containing protein n=1 Tax=Zoogloea sp. 1C4 TaxID=2570190 RepID=UPI0012910E00
MASVEVANIGKIFGEVLRRHRSARNISQEELAFQAGVDRTFVSRLERGIRQPTITTLIGIGQALGVSAADLVQETESEYLRATKQIESYGTAGH